MNEEDSYIALDMISDKSQIDKEDFNLLIELSNDKDPEIRSYVAELLVLSNNPISKNILFHLCNDLNELVRVNACDSLSIFYEVDVFNVLSKRVMEDQSNLVKQYALLSIVDIMDKIKINKKDLDNLFNSYKTGYSIGIEIVCYKGLYKLGNDKYLQSIINCFSQSDYHDRCFSVNTAGDLINEKNREIIINSLYKLLKNESSEAVISTIKKIID